MIDMPTITSIRNMRARGDTIAEISRATGVSEPTVRKYLKKDDFSPKLPAQQSKPAILDPYKPAIEAMLDEDAKTWHKQHHTAKRIFERLVAEHNYAGSYTTVQLYVKQRKEERKQTQDQYLDLVWAPGEAQVDFGQADMNERGVLVREHFLTVCFPNSNVGLTQVFHGENAECVCQGLKDIFAYVKGVPIRLVFDNATGVGRKICGEIRTSELFGKFAAHYGFEYSFCNPDSGHEKGSVENKVGTLRRNLFVPTPRFDSLANFNERLLGRCMDFSAKDHYLKGEPETQLFMEDRVALRSLPERDFDVVTYVHAKTDKYGKICLDSRHRYSSDPALGNTNVIVGKTASEVKVYTASGEHVATHIRAYGQAPTDSSDPAAQLSLLCSKQNGWQNSRVRASMPEMLRTAVDGLNKAKRGEVLRTLRNVSAQSGYRNALDAACASVEMLGYVDEDAVEVMARGAADGRCAITYDQVVGLDAYDIAFSLIGDADDACN